ncbi:MAG TPA: lysozyme [Caulobacteraceae bacterium]|nr:lysozyme [Caulobacteraceae bacterium]
MQPRHQVSVAAVELIKRFEGYRRAAAQLPDGRWTIGYGHTRSAREGVRIDEADASALLLYDLGEVQIALNELIFTPLTQNQFDALASFAMNIGVEAFRRSSVLLRINEGSLLQAASALEMWRKADFEGERIVVDSLIRRRAAEKALFLTPTDGFVPTPTPVVRPQIDYMAVADAPADDAVTLSAPLDGEVAVAQRMTEEVPITEPSDPAPSRTEAAAASVNARLRTLLDNLDLAEATAEQRPSPIATEPPLFGPAPADTGETPPPVVVPFPDPSSHARLRQQAAAVAPFPAGTTTPEPPPLEVRPAELSAEAFDKAGFDAERSRPAPASYLSLGFMLAVGVALLATAIYWFVHSHPRMNGATPSVIGWVLGLAGVALLATSAYFLLDRIGQDDEH